MVAGLLAGLLIVEVGLQGARVAARMSESARRTHAQASDGGDLRVVCLGACYTVGVGSPAEASYPAHLERALDARGLDAVVLNRGVRGRTIDYFADHIDSLLDAHRPHVVVVGINRRMSLDASLHARSDGGLILPRMVGLALSPPKAEAEFSGVGVRSVDENTMLELDGEEDYLTRKAAALRTRLESEPQSPELWKDLADLEAARGDYEAATEAFLRTQTGPELRPSARMRLTRYLLAQGDFAAATHHLDVLRGMPGVADRLARDFDARRHQYASTSTGRDVDVKGGIDRARVALLRHDITGARGHIDAVLAKDPDADEAHHLLLYLLHLGGEPLPAPAEATLARQVGLPSDPAFAHALGLYLDRIVAAADAHDARVVVHTLAASPQQVPIIHEEASARGVPVVDLMAALAAEPSPDRLFHPTDHLRLSSEGNAWMAEQVLEMLDEAGLTAPGSLQ